MHTVKLVSIFLQTDNYQKSESEVIADRLWEIAGKKLHVSKTHTKPPQVDKLFPIPNTSLNASLNTSLNASLNDILLSVAGASLP